MDKEQMINQIQKDISLYKLFTCPDYPDLGIHSKQYMDILVGFFNNTQKPFSLIYTDINKLSVVNERFGKVVGDRTLHSLLSIFSSNPLLKNSITIRIGGDEFITIAPGKKKSEVEEMLKLTLSEVKIRNEELHGSGLSFGVEDSDVSSNIEELICIAEYKADIAKNKNRKNDTFLEEAKSSEEFIELPIPKNISNDQKQKWKILNTKINIAVDNHLRDLRPSSNTFEYKIPNVKTDIYQFITAFRNLLEEKEDKISNNPKENSSLSNNVEISPQSASVIHSLFEGTTRLEDLDDKQLEDVEYSLTRMEKNLIRDVHSGLFSNAYYKLFLADKLLKAKQNYQAICFSISGIRPSNTAYGHSITDDRMDRTIPLIIEAFNQHCNYNDEAFSFNKNDCFFIDQSGGNYIAYVPNNKALKKSTINSIVETVNSHYTDGPESTLKIAAASKRNVNKYTIPFFVNSMNNVPNNPIEWSRTLFQVIKTNFTKDPNALRGAPFEEYANKPFVKFARKLKEICNDNKDSLKVSSLESDVNEKSIESVINDLANYYLLEIENSESIENKKFLLENVILALSNHEAYINKLTNQMYNDKKNERKISKTLFSHKKDTKTLNDERE